MRSMTFLLMPMLAILATAQRFNEEVSYTPPVLTIINEDTGEEMLVEVLSSKELLSKFDADDEVITEQQDLAGSWGYSLDGPVMYTTGRLYDIGDFYPTATVYGAYVTYVSGSWATTSTPVTPYGYLYVRDTSGTQYWIDLLIPQSFAYSVSGIPANWNWGFSIFVPGSGSALSPPIDIKTCTLNITWAN